MCLNRNTVVSATQHNYVRCTVDARINGPLYVRISEITDEICRLQDFRPQLVYVQLAVLTVNYGSDRYVADTDAPSVFADT
jgi:hypothetical protein